MLSFILIVKGDIIHIGLFCVCLSVCVCYPPRYLGLGQAQFGCQVGPLGQGEVLGLLEALV